MDAASDRLADRYGRPMVSRRTARGLTLLVAVLFLAGVVVAGLLIARTPVRSEMLSYDHIADDAIAVDFSVSMSPGTSATCTLQALNSGRAQVGFVEVDIPPQEQRTTAHHVEISTQGKAVTAEIVRCSAS